MPSHRYWHELTAADFAPGTAANLIAVLPVAAIEQHGPHLPVFTDACIAEGMLKRTIALLPADFPVLFLPPQNVGKSNEHISSPGTLSLSWETLTRVLLDLGDSVARAGVRKLVLVNSHGGNVPVLDVVARELRVRHEMLAVASAWSRFGYPEGMFATEEHLYGIHGGDMETSVMLHLRPDLVRMERARDFPSAQLSFSREFAHLRAHGPHQFGWKAQDLNPDGVVGNAAAATAEKGRAVVEHQVAGFIDLLRDVQRFDVKRLWRP